MLRPVIGLIYLAALVFGMGTLLMQFVLSHVGGDAEGDHELEAGGSGDLDLDGDGDIGGDFSHDIEIGVGDHDLGVGGHDVDADGDADHGADGDTGSPLGIVLSMRFWTFALMAFGLIGTPMHYFGMSGSAATFGIALLFGLGSGTAAGLTFRAMRKSVSSAIGRSDTVGKMAEVTVPLRKGHVGKVRVTVKGTRLDMLATTDSDQVRPGARVVVVGFRGGEALVEPIDDDEMDEASESGSAG